MYRVFLISVVILISSSKVIASDFIEGVHYEVLQSESHVKDPSVIEFFSFFCGACYQFKDFHTRFTEEANYKKYHVDFIGNRNASIALTEVLSAAIHLGVESEYIDRVFQRHFQERNFVSDREAALQILSSVAEGDSNYESVIGSFQTRSLQRRMSRLAERYEIDATPTFIINETYKLNNRAFRDSEDVFADIEKAIIYLQSKSP